MRPTNLRAETKMLHHTRRVSIIVQAVCNASYLIEPTNRRNRCFHIFNLVALTGLDLEQKAYQR